MKRELKTIDLKCMGQRIKAQREAIHMKRSQLATLLDVSAKFAGDIEYGYRGVSIQTLYKLSQILDLTTDYILEGEPVVKNEADPKVERIKENILGPLSTCNMEQLKCMEQIARYYVEGIVSKE